MNKRNGLTNQEYHDVSKDAIETALIFLMKEKNYANISVMDICKKAGVSRTFFYKHYTSKDDIIRDIIIEMNDVFKSIAVDHDAIVDKLGFVLMELAKKRFEYSKVFMLLGTGQSDVVVRCVNTLADEAIKDDYDFLQLVYFFSGAICNLLSLWAKNGMRETPEEIGRLVQKLLITEQKP